MIDDAGQHVIFCPHAQTPIRFRRHIQIFCFKDQGLWSGGWMICCRYLINAPNTDVMPKLVTHTARFWHLCTLFTCSPGLRGTLHPVTAATPYMQPSSSFLLCTFCNNCSPESGPLLHPRLTQQMRGLSLYHFYCSHLRRLCCACLGIIAQAVGAQVSLHAMVTSISMI